MHGLSYGGRPQRRSNGLASERFTDGTAVLLDEETSEAHGLDTLSSQIWDLSDGTHTVSEMASELDAPLEAIVATLGRLEELGLLDEASTDGHTRRSMLFRTVQVGGGLAVGAGVINSMALPALASAVSTVVNSLAITYDGSDYTFTPQIGTPMTVPFPTELYFTATGLQTTTPTAVGYVAIGTGMNATVYMTLTTGLAGTEASYGSTSSQVNTSVPTHYPYATASTPVYVTIGT
jgi:hypothetical protein